MRKLAVYVSLLFLVPAFISVARAQESSTPSKAEIGPNAGKPPAHFYRLDFVLKELDQAGRPVNSRAFSIIVSTAGTRSGTFVVGSKIPIVTGSEDSKNGPDKLMTEFQYVDIGVKSSVRDLREDGGGLTFHLDTVVSNLETPSVLAGVSEPVISQNEWNADVLIPIGKATTVFKSDSLDNKGSMQLEVTATRVE